MKQNNELSLEELAGLVQRLQARVDNLEARLTELRDTRPVPEEDLMAIAAAASAYLGYKGKVRAVSYANRTGWSARTSGVSDGREALPNLLEGG